MPAPNVADVRLLPNAQPGFPGYTDAYISQAIDIATREYADMVGSKDYFEIVRLSAAMDLANDAAEDGEDGADTGPVTSASAGGVSMSVGLAFEAVKIDALERNRWGRRLKRLLRINGPYSRVGTLPGSYR